MNYSYAMGIGKQIYDLKKQGFKIKKCGEDYKVKFPRDKAKIWEEFIAENLDIDYWNEYLTEDNELIFIFKLKDGMRRYEVKNFESDEVLKLCEKLCDCKFPSIKDMLMNNKFYRKIIGRINL